MFLVFPLPSHWHKQIGCYCRLTYFFLATISYCGEFQSPKVQLLANGLTLESMLRFYILILIPCPSFDLKKLRALNWRSHHCVLWFTVMKDLCRVPFNMLVDSKWANSWYPFSSKMIQVALNVVSHKRKKKFNNQPAPVACCMVCCTSNQQHDQLESVAFPF